MRLRKLTRSWKSAANSSRLPETSWPFSMAAARTRAALRAAVTSCHVLRTMTSTRLPPMRRSSGSTLSLSFLARMMESAMSLIEMPSCMLDSACRSTCSTILATSGSHSSSMYEMTSEMYVFSILPLTTRAAWISTRFSSSHVMMGVLMSFEALMISLMRGTPCVILMPATPAKWNVFSVI